MSVAAESSRTALEIYQPLIVGLGAVVIGFLFNTWLEWWRSSRERRQAIKDLRLALIFDIEAARNSLGGAKLTLSDTTNYPQVVSIRLPVFLSNCDPKEIGRLSQREVIGLAHIITSMESLSNTKSADETHHSTFFVRVPNEDIGNQLHAVVGSIQDRCENVLSLLKGDKG